MCWKRKKIAKQAETFEITEIESILLKSMYMRGTFEYEITTLNDEATISKFRIVYSEGEGRRKLRSSVVLPQKDVLDKIKEFELSSWDGFNGNFPKDVLDGVSFTFLAIVNNGRRIYANGSENFPPHYEEFVRWLNEILAD